MEKKLKSNIGKLRQAKGLTQEQLALQIKMNESTIRNWEKGRTGLEIFEYVARLCEVLECHPRDLINDDNDPLKKITAE